MPGNLAVVQGVGYPNPNRSHFRSTEIWQTASDSDKIEKYGWLGRYFDNACAGADPTVGVTIGSQLPEAFFAKTPKGICFNNPQNYRFMANGRRNPAADPDRESLERAGNVQPAADGGQRRCRDENSGGTIGALPAGMPMQGGRAVDFIERTALDAQVSSDEVRNIAARVQNQADVSGLASGQFAQARRQAHRRRPADARLLRFAGRLRHAHQPDRHAAAAAARNWAIRRRRLWTT